MKYYKLHLIRHGLTAGNLQGLYIGSGTDLPLCAEGRAQLQELKAQFRYPEVSLVFTSPLLRATQTADVLFPGVRQIELQDLREMAFGKFEGRPLQQLVKDPEFARWMYPTSRAVPAGAEDRQAFFERTSGMLMKMFEYLLRTHTQEAACVTHGGVIMNMLAQHALPFRKPEEWMTDPGAGYSLRLDAEMWMRDHLAEAYDVVPCGYLDGAEEYAEYARAARPPGHVCAFRAKKCSFVAFPRKTWYAVGILRGLPCF